MTPRSASMPIPTSRRGSTSARTRRCGKSPSGSRPASKRNGAQRMRRTNLLSMLGVLATVAFASSCDSFLDPTPSDVLTPENFYRTSSDAVAAVNGVYEQVKWSYWLGFWYISDIATDDIFAAPRFGSDGHRMSDWIFGATEWPMGDMWGSAYKIINRAHVVLDRVPAITMDPALRTRGLDQRRPAGGAGDREPALYPAAQLEGQLQNRHQDHELGEHLRDQLRRRARSGGGQRTHVVQPALRVSRRRRLRADDRRAVARGALRLGRHARPARHVHYDTL